ncbi:hypothetical protein GGR13_002354 [Brevundimonas variabilis]|uniref:Uncharacterized protein n=1 Tax=Brevundimonas variabilis TaxID=74312 RepID=A0A7W9CKA0_9CAUL|nr:hypothetical protein [Brevundimonas variabilis]
MSGLIGCLAALSALCAQGQEVRLDGLQIVHALAGRSALMVNDRGAPLTSGAAERFYRDGRYTDNGDRVRRKGSYHVSNDQICVTRSGEDARMCRYLYKTGPDYYFKDVTGSSSLTRLNITDLE